MGFQIEFTEIDTWTKEGVKKLLYAIDHFCEMVFSFASKFNFLHGSQRMSIAWDQSPQNGDNFLRDDPTDPVMVEKVLPYIRDVIHEFCRINCLPCVKYLKKNFFPVPLI